MIIICHIFICIIIKNEKLVYAEIIADRRSIIKWMVVCGVYDPLLTASRRYTVAASLHTSLVFPVGLWPGPLGGACIMHTLDGLDLCNGAPQPPRSSVGGRHPGMYVFTYIRMWASWSSAGPIHQHPSAHPHSNT